MFCPNKQRSFNLLCDCASVAEKVDGPENGFCQAERLEEKADRVGQRGGGGGERERWEGRRKERESWKERQTGRQADRQTETERGREIETERQRKTETETQREEKDGKRRRKECES